MSKSSQSGTPSPAAKESNVVLEKAKTKRKKAAATPKAKSKRKAAATTPKPKGKKATKAATPSPPAKGNKAPVLRAATPSPKAKGKAKRGKAKVPLKEGM
ncbi:histone H1E-like [Papaver somniferum]|uniref:histone H1E-like n=1 Tax=Papaver somniferum TaxID=3469 RepID=UPI000E6F9BB6|nr:histone H1E-like [Papaver somniferum]